MLNNKQLLKVSKNISVLYAEDEKTIREQYAAIFTLLFKEVTCAENGLTALDEYQKKRYDLIITDLTMPEMSGVSLISKILEIDPNQHIIIMTAHNSNENLRSSIDFQVDGILLKPVNKDKLFKLLDKVCYLINSEKEDTTLKGVEDRLNNLLLNEKQDLFIVVVDKFNEIMKEFGIEVKNCMLNAVKEHLSNFGIKDDEMLKIHNDVMVFTTYHGYLDNILETLQDFSQKNNVLMVEFHDLKIYITLSYGFVMFRKQIQDYENNYDYMHHIDGIIDEIKNDEHSTYVVKMDVDLEEAKKSNALNWLSTTVNALKQKAIVPFYQPMVDMKTLQIESYEIYSRIKQDKKYILPKFFIDLSEKAGILEDISRTIFEQGFKKLSTTKYSFHINIGNSELRDHALVDYLVYLSSRFDIEQDRVILDVLNHENINPTGKRIKTILKLKDLGFKIALKGFANASINMELISIIQPDYIKINQILVQKSLSDEHMKLMLSFLLEYTSKANIQSILLNVEDENILDEGRRLGFDYVQGYLIARPSETLVQTQLKAL